MFPMKSLAPNPAHLAFRAALEQAVAAHGLALDAMELLALTSHLVGQLVALQDQRVVTPEMAMQVVMSNLHQGNQESVNRLLGEAGGHA